MEETPQRDHGPSSGFLGGLRISYFTFKPAAVCSCFKGFEAGIHAGYLAPRTADFFKALRMDGDTATASRKKGASEEWVATEHVLKQIFTYARKVVRTFVLWGRRDPGLRSEVPET